MKEEIGERSISAVRFQTAVESGRLKIRTPSEVFLNKAKTSATAAGDTFYLSETDLNVLALALELRMSGYAPFVVTDDYSIQNVAHQMGIGFASLATFGIRRQLQWVRYCPACHRVYAAGSKLSECSVCATKLKRKPIKGDRPIHNLSECKTERKSSVDHALPV